MPIVSADGLCNAIDFVDPRRFRREDGEGCEMEKSTDHHDANLSLSSPQQVIKLDLLLLHRL